MKNNFRRIVSGIQPSGTMHLGNYLGAVKLWMKLANDNYENKINGSFNRENVMFFIADYHSITTKFSFNEITNSMNEVQNTNNQLDNMSLKTLAFLLASGLDPKKCTLFLQSSIPEHTELQWILSSITPLSALNTMIQFKEKKINSNGIYSYPVLMAADVLLYKATEVPVGEDQKQHLELIGKLTDRLNKVCGSYIFEKPICLNSNFPKIMSLKNANVKMSKSDITGNGIIYLSDSNEEIDSKIIKAKTDSIGTIKFNKNERPDVSNLIHIYSSLSELSIEDVEKKFENVNTFEFKKDLSKLVVKEIGIISEKYNRLIKHEKEYLRSILIEGKSIASEIAKKNIEEIKDCLKFLKL